MKHKHAEVLMAIAEGKDVEFYCADVWITATIQDSITNPLTHDHFEWRIKPEPNPDVVMYGVACFVNGRYTVSGMSAKPISYDNLKLTFNGEELKSAEVLK